MKGMPVKRVFDIIAASLGLFLLGPILALVAFAIIMTDGRPVLFRQKRKGRAGNDFHLIKFRSMTARRNAEQGEFDAGSTSRVTRTGRFLRKTKLDELPQLWNVLTGDMSLVGPRPEVRKWVEAYPERWARILTVRPGITDPASIEFRDEEELLAAVPDPERYYRVVILPKKLDLYEHYVGSHTFSGDLLILFKTFLAVAS